MSRVSGGNPQIREMRATNNIYTILVAVALAVAIAGLVALFMQASTLFQGSGLMP